MFPSAPWFLECSPGVFLPQDPWAGTPWATLTRKLHQPVPDDPAARLERIAAWEQVIAWAQARQVVEMAGFVDTAAAGPPPGFDGLDAVESAEAEIALILHTTTRAAGQRADEARTWVHHHPATLAALQSGKITLAKARIITDGLTELAEDAAAAAESRLLDRAAGQTPGQLRETVRRAVLKADPDAARRRQARKRRDRKVVLYPERDGMATLSATLPAAEATGMWAVLDQHARACPADDDRSMDARRVDTLVDLVLGETGFASTGTAAAATAAATTGPDIDHAGPDHARPNSSAPDHADADADQAWPDDSAPDHAGPDHAGPDHAGPDHAPIEVSAAARVAGGGVEPVSDRTPTSPHADGPSRIGGCYPGETADLDGGTADRTAWGRWLTRNHTTDQDPAARTAEEDELLSRAPTGSAATTGSRPAPARTPDPSRLPGLAPPGGAPATRTAVSVQIRVTVPLDVLTGVRDDPAELAGYGPITAEQARDLAADPDSVWRRLVTDPLSGALLDVGDQRYRPPSHLTEHVVSRHATCQFPGCRTPAHRCDLDHNIPFGHPDGVTSSANLGPKCRPHHRIKGMPGWGVTQYGDGTIVWTTPSGHQYLVEPPPVGPVRPTPAPVPAFDEAPPPF